MQGLMYFNYLLSRKAKYLCQEGGVAMVRCMGWGYNQKVVYIGNTLNSLK